MEIVHAQCCGLDVHKKTVVACVMISQADGLIERQVRTFKTMTVDLLALADWLSSLNVTDVALESTGVYWRPYDNVLTTCSRTTRGPCCWSTRSTCELFRGRRPT
jgi:hypothetical protein